MRLAAPDVPAMPFSPPLEHAFLVDAEKIGAALRRLIGY
jgi:2-oxoisovalerate dehydrogenase E1 component beta subunit